MNVLRAVLHRVPFGIGLWWSVLLAFNVVGEWARPGFDATDAWLPFVELHRNAGRALMIATAALVIWALARPPHGHVRYKITQAVLFAWIVLTVFASVNFYMGLASGQFRTLIPVPVAALSGAGIAVFALHLRRRSPGRVWRVKSNSEKDGGPEEGSATEPASAVTGKEEFLAPEAKMPILRAFCAMIATGIVIFLFCLGQFFLVGRMEQVRTADCIIIMGAGVKANGTAPRSLHDRTRRGCDLYRAGHAPMLILTGGQTRAGRDEAELMAEIARDCGVPRDACILDPLGITTFRSALSCREIMDRNGWKSALVVTNDYHLSRTLMTFRRADVGDCYPVYAPRSGIALKDFTVIARETAAWVYYYFRPLWQPMARERGTLTSPLPAWQGTDGWYPDGPGQ